MTKPSGTGCKRCCFTGVLAGFGLGTSVDALDRPCNCASPAAVPASDRWELVKSECDPGTLPRMASEHGAWEPWHFTFAKGSQSITFRVIAWYRPLNREAPYTSATRFTHVDEWGQTIFGEGVPSVELGGEACVEMVRDRLLCGLRDGSVRGTVRPPDRVWPWYHVGPSPFPGQG
jgi:hypothetical protein